MLKVKNPIEASYIHYKTNQDCEVNLDDLDHKVYFIFNETKEVTDAHNRYNYQKQQRLPLDVDLQEFDMIVSNHVDSLTNFYKNNKEKISLARSSKLDKTSK